MPSPSTGDVETTSQRISALKVLCALLTDCVLLHLGQAVSSFLACQWLWGASWKYHRNAAFRLQSRGNHAALPRERGVPTGSRALRSGTSELRPRLCVAAPPTFGRQRKAAKFTLLEAPIKFPASG